jgi:hypothetical protein
MGGAMMVIDVMLAELIDWEDDDFDCENCNCRN